MRCWSRYALLIILMSGSSSLISDEVVLPAIKDNTIFSKNDATSNALGILFTGTTNQANTRRALLAFDVNAQIPPGSTVTAASLTLAMTEGAPESGVLEHSLHRLLQDWGEGSSYGTSGNGGAATPGDATWSKRFYPDVAWLSPGGDFVAEASATVPVGETPGYITWGSTAGMVADVQSWLDSPAESFGWILVSTEDIRGAARKFGNREDADSAIWPRLTVEFTPPALTRDMKDVPTLGQHGLAILAALMLGIGLILLRRTL